MKIAFGVLFVVFATGGWADSVTCTGPLGAPIACSASPLTIVADFPTLTEAGNVISSSAAVFITNPGNFITPNGEGVSATAIVNDSFLIPSSPAGDVLEIYGVFGEHLETVPGCCSSSVIVGLSGTTGYPAISVDPYAQDADYYCRSAASCKIDVTVPANAFSELTIQDSEYVFGNGNDPYETGGGFDEIFTISRFQSDGVTPDPFVASPEPASWGLLLVAGSALALRARKQ